jgi:hypothetical protein
LKGGGGGWGGRVGGEGGVFATHVGISGSSSSLPVMMNLDMSAPLFLSSLIFARLISSFFSTDT